MAPLTRHRLTRIAPLQAGIVMGVLYGLLALIVVPFFILVVFFGGESSAPFILVFFLIPIGYAIVGFLTGVLVAALYNLVAGWTGGIELELSHIPPPSTDSL